jgi:hypothetical protein
MADGVWGGLLRLTQREACLADRVHLGRYAHNGLGLARGDMFDWLAEIDRVERQYAPGLVLVSLGLNDRQPIVGADRTRIPYPSDAWRQAYRDRVAALARRAATCAAGVLWIGNPVQRDAAAQAQMAEINDLTAAAIAGLRDPKAAWLAPWRLSASGADAFRQYGPDASGARVQLRAPDGVHFTAAGYDRVADHVLPVLLAQLQAADVNLVYP